MATPPPTKPTTGCGGDGCASIHPWPLHHLRHRGVFRRFCTSCVLRSNAGSFCSSCFDLLLLDSTTTTTNDDNLARCNRCPAVAHLSCVPDPFAAANYICPPCSSPSSSSPYFLPDARPRPRTIDLPAAKALLAASRLAAASMARASASARVDAEKKAMEAALARRQACEVIDRALSVSKHETQDPKKKLASMSNAIVICHEPIQTVPPRRTAAAQGNAESNTAIVPPHVAADEHTPNHIKIEESKMELKRLISSSQDVAGVKEQQPRLTTEPDKRPRFHQPNQDGSVSRTNNGAMLMGMQNVASLHS